MPESLDHVLRRLREDRSLFLISEEATRQGAVLPILARLGWDRDNLREVVPEFPVANGRVDYCLRVKEKNAVFIEVKRVNEELDAHQDQLLEYAFREGVELAVLTNGILWWLYLPLLEGSWDQRKFLTIDIQQQSLEIAAQHFLEFLQRQAIANGTAIERAKALHAGKEKDRRIRQTIPEAWKQLCLEPDEQLLDLFAERVERLCGHRPDQELLAQHLALLLSGQQPPPGGPAPPKPPVRSRRRTATSDGAEDWTNKKPVAFTFKAEKRAVSTFKEILLGLCSALTKDHPGDFARVLALRGRKRAYFSREFRGMKSPQEVSGTGIYAETNLSANSIRDICGDLLVLFGYSRNELRVEVEGR